MHDNAALMVAVSYACHEFGDYVLQSDWMANEKGRNLRAAAAHALTYTLCFTPLLLLGASPLALLVIGATHLIIDKQRLARYVCWAKNLIAPRLTRSGGAEVVHIKDLPAAELFRTGEVRPHLLLPGPDRKLSAYAVLSEGSAREPFVILEEVRVWHHPWRECSGTGYHQSGQPWMNVWLMIRADNAIHMAINILALLLVS